MRNLEGSYNFQEHKHETNQTVHKSAITPTWALLHYSYGYCFINENTIIIQIPYIK